jgi:hypothetical protein
MEGRKIGSRQAGASRYPLLENQQTGPDISSIETRA